MAESLPRAYKPWLIASLAVLVGGLLLLATVAGTAFVLYAQTPLPIWIVLLGLLAAGGVALGFAGFFLMMLTAGWRSMREAKKMQIISPAHTTKD